MRKNLFHISVIAILLLLNSCASKKQVVKTAPANQEPNATIPPQTKAIRSLTFVRKVADNRVYVENIVGSADITIQAGGKEITVPGSLRMRKDEVIRLQLFMPLLGTEIARIDFMPHSVLVVDRMHKKYVTADYDQLAYLRDNGLSFFSLQSLFWNQLFLPGKEHLTELDLNSFEADVDREGEDIPITVDKGNLKFSWNADKNTGLIESTTVKTSDSDNNVSIVQCDYSDFKAVGVKRFPSAIALNFSVYVKGKQQRAQMILDLDGIRTDSSWESRTSVSDRYQKVEVKDILGKLLERK